MHVSILKQGLRFRRRSPQQKSQLWCLSPWYKIYLAWQKKGRRNWTRCSVKELIGKIWRLILAMAGWRSMHEKIYITAKCCYCYYIQKVQKALKALTFLVQNITCSFCSQQRRHKMNVVIARNCLVLNSDAYFLSLGKVNNH